MIDHEYLALLTRPISATCALAWICVVLLMGCNQSPPDGAASWQDVRRTVDIEALESSQPAEFAAARAGAAEKASTSDAHVAAERCEPAAASPVELSADFSADALALNAPNEEIEIAAIPSRAPEDESEIELRLPVEAEALPVLTPGELEETRPAQRSTRFAQAPQPALQTVEAPAGSARPKVALSEEHAATCKVKVGDKMPQFELPLRNGGVGKLSDRYGERMTLVVFWSPRLLYAREQFIHLQREAVAPLAPLGVSVVAIAVGGDAEAAANLADEAGYTGALMFDEDQSAFDMVAASRLPRTYLLDAAGQVLWFDMEYSRSFRRELAGAVRYFARQ